MAIFEPLLLAGALLIQQSATPTPPPPAALQSLLQCRAITDGAARLACFDRQAAAFEVARSRQEVVVVDQEQIRQSRRSLFGLTLPRIPLLGGSGSDTERERAEPYVGVVRSIRETRDGKWVVGVDDAVWQTTEVEAFAGPPRVGSSVTIRRAPLGGFVLTAEGRRGLRAVRLR